jgi:hypothetical protein
VIQDLGTLSSVPVREVWTGDETEFTRWLQRNTATLTQALSMGMEVSTARHGRAFSLDLVGTLRGSDAHQSGAVTIVSQLTPSDEAHLGRLISLAGSRSPVVAVWCAPEFHPEHLAAIEWLNAVTQDSFACYGVQVAAVRIDSSRPAPAFRVLAGPASAGRQPAAEETSDGDPDASASWSEAQPRRSAS